MAAGDSADVDLALRRRESISQERVGNKPANRPGRHPAPLADLIDKNRDILAHIESWMWANRFAQGNVRGTSQTFRRLYVLCRSVRSNPSCGTYRGLRN